MAVDLSNLTGSLDLEINPPGQNLYPTMTADEKTKRLVDAFWELRMLGLDWLNSFTCDGNGLITYQANAPTNIFTASVPAVFYEDQGVLELGREIQQLIVLMAGYRIALTVFANTYTSVSAKAGPVSSEQQKSAQLLQAVLKAIKGKIDAALYRLSDLGMTTVSVFDSVQNMTENMIGGINPFVGGDLGPTPMGHGYREF
jgi:hypothetical protein